MYKPLSILAVLAAGAAVASATTIAGHMTWVSGTLNVAVTPKPTPQTISLKVGATTQTITGVYVVGTSPLPLGSPFEILKGASQPIAGTFAGTTLIASSVTAGSAGNRIVPMSTAGIISGGIGFSTVYGGTVQLFLPAFTDGSLTFKNGIELTLGTPILSYSVTVPASAGVTTFGTVIYPASSPPVVNFTMNAIGNGVLQFIGTGSAPTLWVAGNITGGAANTFASASLSITTGFAF